MTKGSTLGIFTDVGLAAGDRWPVLDVSDTTMDPAGTDKMPTVGTLASYMRVAPTIAAHDGYGVVVGCACTAPGGNLNIDVAAGITQHGTPGTTATVKAQTVTATSAHATLYRFDLVVVAATGVASIVAGTAAAVPVLPAVPAGSVELATLYVPPTITAFTTAANVFDKRVVIQTGMVINVKDYGARGDTRLYTDGAITTGTATFTSATATFTAQDVGKSISIGGAGAAGVPHNTTISGFTNSTTVTLAANASTTVSGKSFGFGTDDKAAIVAAITAAAALPKGGVVFFPPGIYGAASSITATTKFNFIIRGAGMDVTMIYQLGHDYRLVSFPNPAPAAGTYLGMEDISLWGRFDRLQTEDLNDRKQSYFEADRVWYRRVHSMYSEQMALVGQGTTEAKVENCYIEKSGRDAINMTGSGRMIAIGNTIQECPDDAIAFHTVVGLAVGTINSQPAAIIGNIISKSCGIKLLGGTNAVIAGNSIRFASGYGIWIDYDTVSGEGNKDPIGISITGNSIVDTINQGFHTAGAAVIGTGIWVATPTPNQGYELGRSVTNGSTTASSTNLTSATIAWTSADIGRQVTVTGAGVAGAKLTTRIMSITSGTIAVMETAASTTVSGTATIKLSLLAYIPAQTTAGTGLVAIKGPSTNAWNGIAGAATGVHGLIISGNTIFNGLDGLKTDGTAATVFSDYGFGTLWWFGGSFNPSFVSNVPPTGSATYTSYGITLRDGAVRDVLIGNNTIYGVTAGVYIGGTPVNPAARITGNKIMRANKGVEIAYNVDTFMNVWIEGNEFDLDPIFESTERTAASGQPTGTWTRAAGNTAVAVYSYKAYGVYLVGNRIRNACNLSTGGGTEAVALKDNMLILDSTVTSPSMAGVGIRSADAVELAQSITIQEISDPRLTTYGQLSSVFAQAAAACPTTGTWAAGAFVKNSTPTLVGRNVIEGWLRMTSGTGNVYGTDWIELSALGGQRTNRSTAAQSSTFATDIYLTNSNVSIPAGLPRVGTTYRLKFDVTKTGAGTATPIITVRYGTAGAIGDTARLTFTFGAGTAVADTGVFEVEVSFRTVGSGTSAVLIGRAWLVNNLTITGLSNAVKAVVPAASGGFDSTVAASFIGASYNGGTSASHTVQLVEAELIP